MRCAMRTRDNSTEPPAVAAAVRGSLMTSVRQDAKRTITHLVTRRGVPGDVSDCWRATSAVRRRLIIIGTAFYDYCSLAIWRRRMDDRKSNSIKQPIATARKQQRRQAIRATQKMEKHSNCMRIVRPRKDHGCVH